MFATNGEQRSPSLRSRVLLAIALTATFYTLAVVIASVLIAAPIVLFATTREGNIFLAIAMIGAGLAILRSIVPAENRFEAPGPSLPRDEQPELHALLDEVVAASGVRGPDDVYLDLRLNAAVLEHRRRRILLLGLPLLATLDRDELRAVVAHELGHYAGGDTRVEAWIWRTRVAVLRTAFTLTRSKSTIRRLAGAPFRVYAKHFMRITNAVSRRAEFAADAISARVASPAAAGRALRRLAALSPAFETYLNEDLAPMVNAKRLPPIAAGFIEMAANTELAPKLDELVSAGLNAPEPDPYASHPTLRQRLEALREPTEPTMPPAPVERASALLHDLPQLERALLALRMGPKADGLEPADWAEAGDVHLASQRALAGKYGLAIAANATVGDAGRLALDFAEDATGSPTRELLAIRSALRAKLDASPANLPDEAIDRLAVTVLAAIVIVAVVDAGAEITALPGQPVRVWAHERSVDPLPELARIAGGEGAVERWTEVIAPTGLASVPLTVTP